MTMTKTKNSVRVPEQLGKKIEVLAEAAGRSKASILTEALEAYIERHARMKEQPQDWT